MRNAYTLFVIAFIGCGGASFSAAPPGPLAIEQDAGVQMPIEAGASDAWPVWIEGGAELGDDGGSDAAPVEATAPIAFANLVACLVDPSTIVVGCNAMPLQRWGVPPVVYGGDAGPENPMDCPDGGDTCSSACTSGGATVANCVAGTPCGAGFINSPTAVCVSCVAAADVVRDPPACPASLTAVLCNAQPTQSGCTSAGGPFFCCPSNGPAPAVE
jgi:hypothetical protein